MADRKATPIAKIYEALSAIADKRVTFPADQPGEALVVSSDHSKQYTVRFGDGFYSSNDNATYWPQIQRKSSKRLLVLIGRH
jgi:alanyl-tRNA synthetase